MPGVNSKGGSNSAPLDPPLSEGNPTPTFPPLPNLAAPSPALPAGAAVGDAGCAAVAVPTIAATLMQITMATETVAIQALIIINSLSGVTVGPSGRRLILQTSYPRLSFGMHMARRRGQP